MKTSLLLVSLAFLGLAVAGCIGNPSDVGDTKGGDAASELVPPGNLAVLHGLDGTAAGLLDLPATAGVERLIGARSFEPTLGITPKGTIFMTADHRGGTANKASPTLMRSTDKGATWQEAGPKLPTGDGNPPNTNDPFTYVDPATGRVFMVDLEGTVCSYASWSDNEGSSWTTNPLACGTPGGNDHQSVAAGKPRKAMMLTSYPNVVYYCVNRVVDSACAASWTGGLVFNPLITAFPGVEASTELFCGGLTGHVATGPDGKVYLPRDYCGKASVAISEDDGLTWAIRTINTDKRPDDHEVRVAIDEANNVYAIWISGGLPYLSISKDAGKTWSKALMVAPPGVTGTDQPAIAAGAPGRIAVAYIGMKRPGGYPAPVELIDEIRELVFEGPNRYENVTWDAYLGIVTDALSDHPTVLTVTANDPADPIARGECGRTRCNGMGDFIGLQIDAEGRPWASMVDVCTDTCIKDTTKDFDKAVGFVGTLNAGPALRGELAALPWLITSLPGAT